MTTFDIHAAGNGEASSMRRRNRIRGRGEVPGGASPTARTASPVVTTSPFHDQLMPSGGGGHLDQPATPLCRHRLPAPQHGDRPGSLADPEQAGCGAVVAVPVRLEPAGGDPPR